MKPILFNTKMVRAILDGRKTVTRRAVKPQPEARLVPVEKDCYIYRGIPCGLDGMTNFAPYRSGDILYVRETWANLLYPDGHTRYVYKATDTYPFGEKMVLQFRWHPSIHMPREAARISLQVTDVRVQRVQDITEEDARKEGCKDREDFHRVWNDCYAKPRPVKVKGVIHHYESYPWEDIQETRTYRGNPWYVIGNPCVFVNEFERIGKKEASAYA